MTTPLNPNPRFYKIMLGKGSSFLPDALSNGYVGVGWFADTSLVDKTTNSYSTLRDFNNRWRPVYLSQHPDKSKVTAGLACGYTCLDMFNPLKDTLSKHSRKIPRKARPEKGIAIKL